MKRNCFSEIQFILKKGKWFGSTDLRDLWFLHDLLGFQLGVDLLVCLRHHSSVFIDGIFVFWVLVTPLYWDDCVKI